MTTDEPGPLEREAIAVQRSVWLQDEVLLLSAEGRSRLLLVLCAQEPDAVERTIAGIRAAAQRPAPSSLQATDTAGGVLSQD